MLDTDIPDWVQPYLHPKLPASWVLRELRSDGAHWVGPGAFSVILSGQVESDNKRWLHLSCARPAYLPTWGDLTWIKRTWLGKDLYAVSVMPPESRYVNIHPHCLHLWSCLDGYPLPEFSSIQYGLRTV